MLRCNYDPRYLDPKLPIFYRDIHSFFVQIKSRLKQEDEQEIILFNNKEILIDGKPFFIREWFSKGIISIKDLLHDYGQFLTYEEFQRKYSCKTNFLNFYQVVSAIPHYLLSKARNLDEISKNFYVERSPQFQLLNGHELNLDKAKAKEFYWILNERNLTSLPTGPEKWKKTLNTGLNDGKHSSNRRERSVKRIS